MLNKKEKLKCSHCKKIIKEDEPVFRYYLLGIPLDEIYHEKCFK